MPLNELLVGPNPARDDVQQTDFGYDVIPRYICNNWQEVAAAQGAGAYPFDAIVIGSGMFGGYCAEKLYRAGAAAAYRVLLLDAGAFLLQSHIQNLPQQLGGSIGGASYNRQRDDASGTQNVIWGMPWISNEKFPGVAYCVGGRSLFWGGWSPQLTPDDLANWPPDTVVYLNSALGYASTAAEIGSAVTTDFIKQTALFNALLSSIRGALPLSGVSEPVRRRSPSSAPRLSPACSRSTNSAARLSSWMPCATMSAQTVRAETQGVDSFWCRARRSIG